VQHLRVVLIVHCFFLFLVCIEQLPLHVYGSAGTANHHIYMQFSSNSMVAVSNSCVVVAPMLEWLVEYPVIAISPQFPAGCELVPSCSGAGGEGGDGGCGAATGTLLCGLPPRGP